MVTVNALITTNASVNMDTVVNFVINSHAVVLITVQTMVFVLV
jgi:hypothetical protein